MTIRPLHDNVLILPSAREEKTPGGLFVVESKSSRDRRATVRGEVIAVGPGITLNNGVLVPSDVKVGDAILYQGDTGTPVSIDGVEHFMLSGSTILAVVD